MLSKKFLYLWDMKHTLPYESTGSAIIGYRESVIAKRETNDCVVRAFASSFGVTYDFAHKFVENEFKRKPRCGTFFTISKMCKLHDESIEVNGKKVYPLGVPSKSIVSPFTLDYQVKVKGEMVKRQMTVGTFVKQNPKGSYFVVVKGHAFTIKDGVVVGNLEDSIKLKRPIRAAFEIK